MTSRPQTTLVAACTVLLLATGQAQAKESGKESLQWSEWKAMGGGYVARRRQPPKLELPVNQRQLEGVQARWAKPLSGPDVAQSKTPKLSKSAVSVASAADYSAQATSEERVDALWLRTASQGLHAVSLEAIADLLGKRVKVIRRKANDGAIMLTRGETANSENADYPVPWYFDEASDSILFAAQAYDSFHSAENVYRLDLGKAGAQSALPMLVVEGESPAVASVGIEFPDTLKFEQEPDMMFLTWAVAAEPDADYWFWDMLAGGNKEVIQLSLNVPNPAPQGQAQLRVTLRGFTELLPGDDHHVVAELNGQVIGSIVFDGFSEAVLVADFDQSLLALEGDNTLQLRSIYAQGTTPGEFLDEISLDYNRRPVAENDSLWLHGGSSSGLQTVTGFSSSNLVVIESPAGEGKLRHDILVEEDGLGGWSASFDAQTGVDYLVAEQSAPGLSSMEKDYRSTLAKTRNSADYLIIAPREFAGSAQALSQFRQAAYGQVRIAWLDDIYQEFSAGRENPVALARFMQHVVGRWRQAPRAVVLLGKGSLDEKNRMGYSDSFVPVVMSANPWALAASDSRLLGFEDNAPFAIGRLPIVSDGEGLAYVEKLITHETTGSFGPGLEALLIADDPDAGGTFHANTTETAQRLVSEMGFSQVNALYHPDDTVSDTLRLSESWDVAYVSYDGHGSTAQAGNSRENFMLASEVIQLTNQTKPIFAALTCAVGDDTVPGTRSLAGALVLNPDGGAIAALAPTGLSLDAEAQLMSNAFIDSLFIDGATIGEAVLQAKWQTSDTIRPFMQRMYSVVGEPGIYALP